jgi:hypothetical protein
MTSPVQAALQRVFDEVVQRFDMVIVDTGAGISDVVLFTVSLAQEVLVVATPEPTSLADAYAVIKVLSSVQQRRQIRLLVNQARRLGDGRNVCAQLQQVVRHHPLLLLLQHPSQQELQQQRETSQQQELQQQAPRNPVLQRWQWSGPSRSCPRSHWPKCSSSYEGARCLRCRRNRFMQVCDSAWLLSASSSIRHAGNKLHPLQQVQAHSNSTSSRPVNRNHNSSSNPLAHSSSSSRDHAGQLALLDSSRRLHSSSSSNSRLNSTPHLNHHLRTHQQVAKQLCRQWWRALSSPGIIWGPEHCSAATAMPSCGHRRTRL